MLRVLNDGLSGVALIASWCLLLVLGYWWGVLTAPSSENGFLTVMQSWWRLNITHRSEALAFRGLCSMLGLPLQVFGETDLSLVMSCAASSFALGGFAQSRRRRAQIEI